MNPATMTAERQSETSVSLEELKRRGVLVVQGARHAIAVFLHEGKVYAVDNRCPHMGFPLSQGSLKDGILTCHWHHARFDLESGGTFDPFADDVATYPVEVRDGQVYIYTGPETESRASHWTARLHDGLEQNLPLVMAKSVLALLDAGAPPGEILAIGGQFGARYRRRGWGPGLTILTALANMWDDLAPEDQPRALYHGLIHIANNTAGEPPRFDLDPLPTANVHPARLRVWFRRFIEVRDEEGAERVLRTAIAAGHPAPVVADLLLAAATDHYYIDIGHTVDFINKAFELLDHVGWRYAADLLPSLIRGLANAARSEENQAWRHPIDLVELLEPVFARLPELISAANGPRPRPLSQTGLKPGTGRRGGQGGEGLARLADTLLGDSPQDSIEALVEALKRGAGLTDLSLALCYAAALRVARFHTSNEFGDWITVLHTLTYCNALHQSLKRAPSLELARGIFHGAMSLYLDRFLNMPSARLPTAQSVANEPEDAGALRTRILDLMNRQQQVNEVGAVIYRYLSLGHPDAGLLQTLGHSLLREDGEFHMYQMTEAGFKLYRELREVRPDLAPHALIAVGRYLAAHAPTLRETMQTYTIALRLHRQEDLYKDEPELNRGA